VKIHRLILPFTYRGPAAIIDYRAIVDAKGSRRKVQDVYCILIDGRPPHLNEMDSALEIWVTKIEKSVAFQQVVDTELDRLRLEGILP
jgi:hypothetical protein